MFYSCSNEITTHILIWSTVIYFQSSDLTKINCEGTTHKTVTTQEQLPSFSSSGSCLPNSKETGTKMWMENLPLYTQHLQLLHLKKTWIQWILTCPLIFCVPWNKSLKSPFKSSKKKHECIHSSPKFSSSLFRWSSWCTL